MQTIFQSTFPFTLHTVFKVLESFFTVTLFTVTMETLHSQTLKAHITGQVINSDVEQKWKRANTKDTRLKWVPMLMCVYPTVTVVNSHNYEPQLRTYASFLPTKMITFSSGCMFLMKSNRYDFFSSSRTISTVCCTVLTA